MGSVGPTLAELGDADLLVLWAMRRWLVARRNGERVEAALATPFNLGRMPEGPRLVDELMSRVAVSVSRPLKFGCLHCAVVSRDENQVIAILRLLQTQRMRIALEILLDTVASGAVASVCDAAQRLVDRLAQANLSLARRANLRLVPVAESVQCAQTQ
jgi:hypothetical protein